MLNKNVCPKCGQLYDADAEKCPLCGLPAQSKPEAEAAPQRRRVTEVERQQRQKNQRRDAAEARRREKQARLLADAEEERQLEAAEEQERLEKKRKRLARRGYSEDEIRHRLSMEPKRVPDAVVLPDRRRVPGFPLVVAIFLLLAALLIGGSFLLWRYGLVQIGIYDYLSSSAAAHDTPDTARCDAVVLSDSTLSLGAENETYKLRYTLTPEDCTLPVSFVSSDPAVVEVDQYGVLRAIAPGEAVITVTCGEIEAVCSVSCSFPEDATIDNATVVLPDGLELSATDITFFNPGESTYLHVNNLPNGATVEWKSSDDAIATVEPNGHVVAVGRGLCYVTAVVGDYAASCTVRCNFTESDDG